MVKNLHGDDTSVVMQLYRYLQRFTQIASASFDLFLCTVFV